MSAEGQGAGARIAGEEAAGEGGAPLLDREARSATLDMDLVVFPSVAHAEILSASATSTVSTQ